MDKNEIEKLLEDNENRHSDFQIDNFIIKKQGDTWAQYKQCLREIKSRYESINGHGEKIKAEALQITKSFSFRVWYSVKRAAFWKNKKAVIITRPILKKTNENIKNLNAELDRLLIIARKLKFELGEITVERRAELERESWKNKGVKMAAIDILSTGRISNQTYDFIFSLPKESQLELFSKLSTHQPMALLGFEPDEIRAITAK